MKTFCFLAITLGLAGCQVDAPYDAEFSNDGVRQVASWASAVESDAKDKDSENHKQAALLMAVVSAANKSECTACHESDSRSTWTAQGRVCVGGECKEDGFMASLAVHHEGFSSHFDRSRATQMLPARPYFGRTDETSQQLAAQFVNQSSDRRNPRSGAACVNRNLSPSYPTDASALRPALVTWMEAGAWLPQEAFAAAARDFKEATE